MRIIDINGKEREAISIQKISYQVVDKDGNPIAEEYVEVIIQGQHRKGTWKEWYPLKKFKEMNPEIVI